METPRKDRADCGSLAMLTIELHSNISTGVVRQIRRNITLLSVDRCPFQ